MTHSVDYFSILYTSSFWKFGRNKSSVFALPRNGQQRATIEMLFPLQKKEAPVRSRAWRMRAVSESQTELSWVPRLYPTSLP
ncbi:hypothetical protein CaCOL14_002073 [Colletotrichum acutatum]